MKQLGLMIDLTRCIGCKTCVAACRNHHRLIDHETALPGDMPHYLRVESRIEGTYPSIKEKCWVVPCQHCKNAQCIKACPEKAIRKDPETGIVLIDKALCKGHGKCIEACPYGVIQFDAARRKAHKCDLCFERVTFGDKTVCVEACLTDAIDFGELTMLKQKANEAGKRIIKKMSAMSVLYVE